MLNYLEDAEGRFARDSGVYLTGSSGGVAFITASGKRLGKKHLHGVKAVGIQEALDDWKKLPENERRPGALEVGERGPIDRKHATMPPPQGCLILKIHARYLARDAKSELRTTTLLKDFPGIEKPATTYPGSFEYNSEANPDFMWLTEAEWRSLIPANVRQGDKLPLPDAIVVRLCRFHLLPDSFNGRTGDTWSAVGPAKTHGIRAREATLTVVEASPTGARLTLDGFVKLGNAFDPDAGPVKSQKDHLKALGFEARLRGHLNYDAAKKAFTRFDLVALGDLYGNCTEGSWYYRPGRNPVGFAFELSDGATPVDRLPPRGNMTRADLERYLGLAKGALP
jgi:hypothetical protein